MMFCHYFRVKTGVTFSQSEILTPKYLESNIHHNTTIFFKKFSYYLKLFLNLSIMTEKKNKVCKFVNFRQLKVYLSQVLKH